MNRLSLLGLVGMLAIGAALPAMADDTDREILEALRAIQNELRQLRHDVAQMGGRHGQEAAGRDDRGDRERNGPPARWTRAAKAPAPEMPHARLREALRDIEKAGDLGDRRGAIREALDAMRKSHDGKGMRRPASRDNDDDCDDCDDCDDDDDCDDCDDCDDDDDDDRGGDGDHRGHHMRQDEGQKHVEHRMVIEVEADGKTQRYELPRDRNKLPAELRGMLPKIDLERFMPRGKRDGRKGGDGPKDHVVPAKLGGHIELVMEADEGEKPQARDGQKGAQTFELHLGPATGTWLRAAKRADGKGSECPDGECPEGCCPEDECPEGKDQGGKGDGKHKGDKAPMFFMKAAPAPGQDGQPQTWEFKIEPAKGEQPRVMMLRSTTEERHDGRAEGHRAPHHDAKGERRPSDAEVLKLLRDLLEKNEREHGHQYF